MAAIAIMIVALIIVMAVSSTPDDDTQTPVETQATGTTQGVAVSMNDVKAEINSMNNVTFYETKNTTDYVKITVANFGDIIIKLRGDVAPLTVQNFKKLVDKGFYNNMIFHRVMQNFMIQGGGEYKTAETNETIEHQQSPTAIKGEFSANGIGNNLKHVKGVISMARIGNQNNSATSQFFICNADNASVQNLDGQYATFGYVVAGLDVVDAISAVACDNSNPQAPRPLQQVVISNVCFVTTSAAEATTGAETTTETAVETMGETTAETTVETTVETTTTTKETETN